MKLRNYKLLNNQDNILVLKSMKTNNKMISIDYIM